MNGAGSERCYSASVAEILRCVEVETGGAVTSAVIWMHGLGADGHDFEPIVPHLGLDGLGVRFVFPHAPRRAVSINMGLLMPAWFDVRDLDFRGRPDLKGLAESAAQIEALMARERERGVPEGRVILAGFSQGGALALHVALRRQVPPAGVVALSTFLLEDPADPGADVRPAGLFPIFQAHGTGDPMIPLRLGEITRDRLQALGYPITFKTYPMQHEVCAEEIADIAAFLSTVLIDQPQATRA
jgi:phospholipase/carboxylesterase